LAPDVVVPVTMSGSKSSAVARFEVGATGVVRGSGMPAGPRKPGEKPSALRSATRLSASVRALATGTSQYVRPGSRLAFRLVSRLWMGSG
jgi:hypothetical protein